MWDNFIYYGKINQTETVISVLMGHFIKKLLFILLFVGVLIAPANAQNEKNMYSYKKIGNKYIVSINNHTEIVKALNAFCKEKGILSGSINGIGAIGELTLRFFNPKTKHMMIRHSGSKWKYPTLQGIYHL